MNFLIESGFVGLTALCILATWYWVRAVTTALHDGLRRSIIRVSIGLLALWLLFVGALALSGALNAAVGTPPAMMLIPLTGAFCILLLHWSVISPEVLAKTPRHWPVAIQTFRIAVEMLLFGLYLAGRAPVQATFEGRNLDILVGLTAPLVAFGMLKSTLSSRVALAWNVLGVLILGNTIFTVLTSAPGPLHLRWPGGAFAELETWPVIWLPSFLVPFAMAAHIFSMRQNWFGDGSASNTRLKSARQ
jgi:hypothetical protein